MEQYTPFLVAVYILIGLFIGRYVVYKITGGNSDKLDDRIVGTCIGIAFMYAWPFFVLLWLLSFVVFYGMQKRG